MAFYNYEVKFPTFDDLYMDRRLPCEPVVIDHDYKWLYSLLRDVTTQVRPGPPFPAPTLDCARESAEVRKVDPNEVVTISVSTCFPGLWGV